MGDLARSHPEPEPRTAPKSSHLHFRKYVRKDRVRSYDRVMLITRDIFSSTANISWQEISCDFRTKIKFVVVRKDESLLIKTETAG